MFCLKCGYSLTNGESYCPKCGSWVTTNASTPVYDSPKPNTKPAPDPEKVSEANGILVWGILSVVFAEFGILGVIFACVTRSKISSFIERYGQLMPKVRIAKYLSLGAIIGGIFYTIFWIFIILIYVLYFAMLYSSLMYY